MNEKTGIGVGVGIVVVCAIVTVAMFAGCIEEKTATPSVTITPTPTPFIASITNGDSSDEACLCYNCNPEYTHMKAFEVGEKYEGAPEPLDTIPLFGYIQPWSGYDPECTLKNKSKCNYLPSQTYNTKVLGVYNGIELNYNKWMEMACEEGSISAQYGGGPFGAVIVQIDDETGEVIRYWRNHNHVTEWNDPTAHAEVTTIRAACKELGVFDLGVIHKNESKLPQKGATSHCEIYSSAEPCPMCYAAICWARIPVLYFAATRFDAAQQGVDFSDEEIYRDIARPYKDRQMVKVYQCTCPNSLDAFNYWKRSKKIEY